MPLLITELHLLPCFGNASNTSEKVEVETLFNINYQTWKLIHHWFASHIFNLTFAMHPFVPPKSMLCFFLFHSIFLSILFSLNGLFSVFFTLVIILLQISQSDQSRSSIESRDRSITILWQFLPNHLCMHASIRECRLRNVVF